MQWAQTQQLSSAVPWKCLCLGVPAISQPKEGAGTECLLRFPCPPARLALAGCRDKVTRELWDKLTAPAPSGCQGSPRSVHRHREPDTAWQQTELCLLSTPGTDVPSSVPCHCNLCQPVPMPVWALGMRPLGPQSVAIPPPLLPAPDLARECHGRVFCKRQIPAVPASCWGWQQGRAGAGSEARSSVWPWGGWCRRGWDECAWPGAGKGPGCGGSCVGMGELTPARVLPGK